jgi:hypothetical protein
MLAVQIKLPRRTVVKLAGDSRGECDFACVNLPNDDDAPDEIAVVMFSRTDGARRFIDDNDLQGWLPAFIAYTELRELLTACEQKQKALWGVVDYYNDARRQIIRSFRIEAAIAAIDAANLETDDPIIIEGHCFAM